MYDEQRNEDTRTEKQNNDNTKEFHKVFCLDVAVTVSLRSGFDDSRRLTISFKHGIWCSNISVLPLSQGPQRTRLPKYQSKGGG